jgi:hypothetical protein
MTIDESNGNGHDADTTEPIVVEDRRAKSWADRINSWKTILGLGLALLVAGGTAVAFVGTFARAQVVEKNAEHDQEQDLELRELKVNVVWMRDQLKEITTAVGARPVPEPKDGGTP